MARVLLVSAFAMGKSLAALLLVAATTASPALSPREVVQRAVVRVLEVLDAGGQASPADRGGVTGALATMRRRAQIRAVADDLFDFEEVSRRALGTHWHARTPTERTEFVGAFTDVLERAYLTKIESYAGEKILYTGEKIDGDFAFVRSRIVPRKPAKARLRETALEYRMLRRDKNARWKVYDVIVDGVSFVSTYRSQFDRIILASSYQALMERIRDQRSDARSGTERP